jgi:hypothetical protein
MATMTTITATSLVTETMNFTKIVDNWQMNYTAETTSSVAATSILSSSFTASNDNHSFGSSPFANRTDNSVHITDRPTTMNSTTSIPELSTPSMAIEDDPWTLPHYLNAMAILTYTPPFLFVLATVGNLSSVIILQHPMFRKSSTGFILSVLAAIDTVICQAQLLKLWLRTVFAFTVEAQTTFGCKIYTFIVYCFPMVSFSTNDDQSIYHFTVAVCSVCSENYLELFRNKLIFARCFAEARRLCEPVMLRSVIVNCYRKIIFQFTANV